MSIRSSNGVLKTIMHAIMLREWDGQNRARNVQKQGQLLRMKHPNEGTYLNLSNRMTV